MYLGHSHGSKRFLPGNLPPTHSCSSERHCRLARAFLYHDCHYLGGRHLRGMLSMRSFESMEFESSEVSEWHCHSGIVYSSDHYMDSNEYHNIHEFAHSSACAETRWTTNDGIAFVQRHWPSPRQPRPYIWWSTLIENMLRCWMKVVVNIEKLSESSSRYTLAVRLHWSKPRSRSNIPTMHHSLWLAIVTMTTVGFLVLFKGFLRSRWVRYYMWIDCDPLCINISMINTWFVGGSCLQLPYYLPWSSLRLRRLLSHIFVGLHCSFNSHICERSFPRIACGHYRQRVHCLLAEPSSSTSQDEGAQMFAEVGLHCNQDAKKRWKVASIHKWPKKNRWQTPEVVSRHHDSTTFESFVLPWGHEQIPFLSLVQGKRSTAFDPVRRCGWRWLFDPLWVSGVDSTDAWLRIPLWLVL